MNEAGATVVTSTAGLAQTVAFEDVFGQGILNVGLAVRGPAILDANRLASTDYSATYHCALYGVNTQGYTGVWSNDISERQWINSLHHQFFQYNTGDDPTDPDKADAVALINQHVPGKIRAPFPVVLHLFVLGQGRGHAGPHQQSGAGTGQGAASAADGAADGRAGQGADDGPGRHVLDKLLFFLTQFGNRCVTFRVILDHRCLRSVLAGATREQKSGHAAGSDEGDEAVFADDLPGPHVHGQTPTVAASLPGFI